MFPTLFSVGWHSYSAGPLTARKTPTGVYTPALDAAGALRKVITWYPTQQSEPNEVRVESGLDLMVPPDFGPVTPRDVVDVPGEGRFEVVGHPEDYTKGPFGFQPGKVVKLKRTQQ